MEETFVRVGFAPEKQMKMSGIYMWLCAQHGVFYRTEHVIDAMELVRLHVRSRWSRVPRILRDAQLHW